MKKVALFTLNGNGNYGNKLQHFALQEFIRNNYHFDVETVFCYTEPRLIYGLKDFLRFLFRKRYRAFLIFDKKINYSHMYYFAGKVFNKIKYDYYLIGSDQVWNITFSYFNKMYLLDVIDNKNKISYSSSFGISNLPSSYNNLFKNNLLKFKSISVREDRGKEIIEELTGRKDVEVLVDPTMLLTAEEWDKVSNRPKKLDKVKEEKYILNYFLGELSEQRKKEIEKIAKKNNCRIINILDKKDPFYTCGPSEFLYLEKHAFLICTDSFHSSVFALLYDRPFVVFDREQKGLESMNSRIDTLISKFDLKNRRFNGKYITKENLNHDYSEAYKILEKEREKSKKFLERALDLKEVLNEK